MLDGEAPLSTAEAKDLINAEVKRKWQNEWDGESNGQHLYAVQRIVGKGRSTDTESPVGAHPYLILRSASFTGLDSTSTCQKLNTAVQSPWVFLPRSGACLIFRIVVMFWL
ncbi:hypothetical protein SKAU_G00007580 [Synaphobranchus kaupii]|uniref:Uncharacterized protein n=1 Tax=Synaphobranchus kaupii TaxID=118154 RepID=A0A9Q1JCM4_SYNKA|nr:hypothetical protein SKAU_G00007580 [Synaphobranchus kaupii]